MTTLKEALQKALIDSAINDALDMRVIVASLEASGFVIVPKDPTEEMNGAGFNAWEDSQNLGDELIDFWRAAIKARPKIEDE